MDNLGGDPKGGVDFAVLGFGSGGFSDFQDPAVLILRENNRDDLVRAELLAKSPPGGVNPRLQEAVLDSREQVVSQHAKENMSLSPVLEMMEDRTFHQRTLQIAEGDHPASGTNVIPD